MTNSKQVRLQDDTLKKLEKQRQGFETPDECINRILSNNPDENETGSNKPKSAEECLCDDTMRALLEVPAE